MTNQWLERLSRFFLQPLITISMWFIRKFSTIKWIIISNENENENETKLWGTNNDF